MNKRKIVMTISLLVSVLLVAVTALIMNASPSTAETGAVLDEETLLAVAVQSAREYGLKSEPTILIAEYVLGREWGPMMTDSEVQYEPDLMVYVVSLKGEFEAGKTRTFLPPDTENTFKPTGVTVGINAHTGFRLTIRSEPVTDLASMTNDFDRFIYKQQSQEEWPPRKFESFPLSGFSPETTAEAQSLP